METHAPDGYICPICLGVQGIESDDTMLKQADLVYKNEHVSSFISSFRIGKAPGHLIVVPNEHIENLYTLPDELAEHIQNLSQRVAVAMKRVYECDGISVLQNNEPAGGQHAFHYHLNIFPRYYDDEIYTHMMHKKPADPNVRAEYAKKMKKAMKATRR